MGGGSKSADTSSTPWGPQGVQLRELYEQARGLFDQGPLQYPGFSTVADRNPYSSEATSNVAGLVNASGGLDSALQQNQATLRGDFLDPSTNPALKGAGQAAAQDITRAYQTTVLPGIASRFGGAGRSAGPSGGPGGNAETHAYSNSQRDLGQELSQMFGGLYGRAYETERGRQYDAQTTAIGLRERQFQDQSALAMAGRDEFSHAQLQLNDMVQRFNFEQYAPYESLGMFKDFISGGAYGTTSSRTQSSPGSLQYAGLGVAGAGAVGNAVSALKG